MATTSEVESHVAAKLHRCDWCHQNVLKGELYKRYRWWDGYDAATVKLHPECYKAMHEAASKAGGLIEFGDWPEERPTKKGGKMQIVVNSRESC